MPGSYGGAADRQPGLVFLVRQICLKRVGHARILPETVEHRVVPANVSGAVRLKLYKGSVSVIGRDSPNSLYSAEHATFEDDAVYDQRDAEGFIKLNALRLRLLKRRG